MREMYKARSGRSFGASVAVVAAAIFSFAFFAGCAPKTAPATEYTVAFDSCGGSAVVSQLVDYGGYAVRPAAPTRSGYSFVDWYADSAYAAPYAFETTPVTRDIVLYAKWDDADAVYYTVTFDSNGGSAVPAVRVREGDKAKAPDAPVKTDATFVGWFGDASFSTQWNFERDAVNSDITLYAKWKNAGEPDTPELPDGDTATATFNVGLDARKSGLCNPPAQTVSVGKKLTQPDVSLDGYTLDGWFVENGDTKWNFDSDTLSRNTTLFARWTAGGGNGGETSSYVPSADLRETSHVYIHYYRADGNYADWKIYSWNDELNDFYDYVKIDESGAVYEINPYQLGINVSQYSKINFIVTTVNWSKDGGDNSFTLNETAVVEDSFHWYVRQGNTSNGSNRFTGGSAITPPAGETEPLRESRSDVNRATAAALPKMPTATETDDMGVGYQIFVASFCDSNGDGTGDIRGIINKLDYLDSLNVDVLWLTPVQSSNSTHGYDCYDYYFINKKFGTNADYRELVYKAHARGMKVIMDLVVNHTSPDNEWFIKSKQGVVETVTYQDGTQKEVHYRDFYRWSRTGGNRKCSAGDGWYFYSSFGDNMPELNYDCQAVRDAMADVAAYWLNYGLDGFRMDAIKHVFMWDESENAPSDVEGGVGDGNWNYNLTKNVEFFKEFNHKLKSKYPHCFLLGEQLSGNVSDVSQFYAGMDSLFDFNTYFDLPSKIAGGKAGDAASAFSSNAQKYESYRGDKPINSMISSNHDVPRLAQKLSTDAQRKLYFAVMLTMPGLSWIYYGDEIGLNGSTSNDNTYRQSMKWTSDWENKCTAIQDFRFNESLKSVSEQENDSGSILYYVKQLAAVRDANPALINGTARYSDENGVLEITCTGDDGTITAYHNFTGAQRTVSASGDALFGSATLPAYGTAIFKS